MKIKNKKRDIEGLMGEKEREVAKERICKEKRNNFIVLKVGPEPLVQSYSQFSPFSPNS